MSLFASLMSLFASLMSLLSGTLLLFRDSFAEACHTLHIQWCVSRLDGGKQSVFARSTFDIAFVPLKKTLVCCCLLELGCHLETSFVEACDRRCMCNGAQAASRRTVSHFGGSARTYKFKVL
jgi:hypothetical protein